jgi:hypothetical protein
MDVAHTVDEFCCLLLNGGDHTGMGMTDGSDTKRGGEVEISIAIDIGDKATGGGFPEDGEAPLLIQVGDIRIFDRREFGGEGA